MILRSLANSIRILVWGLPRAIATDTWKILNDTAADLPRRLDDWTHDHRERQGMPPDPKLERRRADRARQ